MPLPLLFGIPLWAWAAGAGAGALGGWWMAQQPPFRPPEPEQRILGMDLTTIVLLIVVIVVIIFLFRWLKK